MIQENNENILIKVIYYSKSGLIFEKKFDQEATFGDIINYFKANNSNKLLTIKRNYSYMGITLKNSDKIKNLVYFQKNKSYEIEIKIEINENDILDDESEPIIPKMVKPKCYSFGLYIYLPKDGKIILDEFTPNKIIEFNLDQINSGSSYCNSPNSFFISGGGVYSKNPVNYFWIINNQSLNIEIKKMPFGKREHSMIYLPNNIVFIVGGNDKKCFFYDIKKDKFSNWANLNNEYFRPVIINSQNFLYCLKELNREKNFFERTNISSKNPSWEKIFPKFKRNVKLNNKKIFWVSKSTNNSIIFGAGEKNRLAKTYIYDLSNNEISLLDHKFEVNELDNKKFDKVSKYYNVAIPKYYETERNILVYDKKIKKVSKIHFENDNDIEKLKMKDYDKEEENEISKIKIRTKVLNDDKINKNNSNSNSYKKLKNNNKNFNDSTLKNLGNEYIGEIPEDDEDKNDNRMPNNNKLHQNIFINHNNIQFGENGEYFRNNENKNILREKNNKEQEDLKNEGQRNNDANENLKINENSDLNPSIIKSNETDTFDKLGNTDKSLIRQIGNNTKDKRNHTEKVNPKNRKNKLPIINKRSNVDNKTLPVNKNNYKIENTENNTLSSNIHININNNNENNSINIEQRNINEQLNNNNEIFNNNLNNQNNINELK